MEEDVPYKPIPKLITRDTSLYFSGLSPPTDLLTQPGAHGPLAAGEMTMVTGSGSRNNRPECVSACPQHYYRAGFCDTVINPQARLFSWIVLLVASPLGTTEPLTFFECPAPHRLQSLATVTDARLVTRPATTTLIKTKTDSCCSENVDAVVSSFVPGDSTVL